MTILPTDTTPASVRLTRPFPYRKRQATCQGSIAEPPRPVVSEPILLLNFESPHRENIAIVLRGLGLRVFIPEAHGISLQELKDDEIRYAALILFDLTRLNHDNIWLPLRRICRLRKTDEMPLMVSCCSRIYRGPDFYLLVEKLGARMTYYAE
jgi:hypothetical protein